MINVDKLKSMGSARVRAACIVHAERALCYMEEGNDRMFQRHVDLLDQCAAIGRRLNGVEDAPGISAAKLIQMV